MSRGETTAAPVLRTNDLGVIDFHLAYFPGCRKNTGWSTCTYLRADISTDLCRGVRFMGYWTLSNIPLFLLAAPMLYIMARTASLGLAGRCDGNLAKETRNSEERSSKTYATDEVVNKRRDALLFRLALPQLTLAGLALTTFHVQIITRISSGYPLWYLVLAREITDEDTKGTRFAKWTVRWMVMYGLIQGVLFASFLPPA